MSRKGKNNQEPANLASKQARGEQRIIKEKFDNERKAPPIQAMNDFHKKVLKAIKEKQIVVVTGPAGVGKSFLTMATAADWLVKGQIDKIILTRPAVGMGKTLGLLKGDLDDKFDPYLAPLIEVFVSRYGRGRWETCLNAGNIEKLPLEYVRGRNISGVAIIDESQNTTPDEMFALITRVTEDGKLFVIGDPLQTDVKQESGLVWLSKFVRKHHLEDYIDIIEATSDDIVRGGLCKAFIKAMEKEAKTK